MTEPRTIMARAATMADENLVACARELLDWDETTLLVDGHVRAIARVISDLGSVNHLDIARSVVEKAVLRYVANVEVAQ